MIALAGVLGALLGAWAVPAVSRALLARALRRGGHVVSTRGCFRGLAAAAGGLGMGAWASLLVALGLPVSVAATLCLCGLAMAAAVACDVRMRLIPWESCAAMAAAGAAAQLLARGAWGLVWGAACGVAVLGVCAAVNAGFRRLRGEEAVGGGDLRCMAALSLASGPAAATGFALSYLAAALVGGCAVALRRMDAHQGMPMAPFYVPWLVCAALCCA